MAVTFKAVLASGGTALTILFTTSDTSLYGQTITISKNGTTVGTTAFDNTGNASYTVREAGTYDVVCGAASDSVTVQNEYPVELSAIPDGSTVTPVNDIQTWLNCAGIFNKTTYTTISDVLADTTTLLALINSNNSIDYMVRSHAWCADVCADATAMTYIGANNYAADTLLADDNPGLVPVMTSDTTPSGECVASNTYSGEYPYFAFDGNDSTKHHTSVNKPISEYYLGYIFPSNTAFETAEILADSFNSAYYYDVAIYGGNTINNMTKISNTVRVQANTGAGARQRFTITNSTNYSVYCLKVESANVQYTNASPYGLMVYTLQFYAKDGSWLESICNSTYFESVLNVKVPTMTGNTTPSGEAFANASYTAAQYYPWKAFNSGETQGWMSDNKSPYLHANDYIGYAFTSAVKIYMSAVTLLYYSGTGQITGKFQASSDGGTDYKDITDIAIATMSSANTPTKVITNQNLDAYSRYRYVCTTQPNSANHYGLRIQFYGRAAS